VALDKAPRDGRFIEMLGTYDPLPDKVKFVCRSYYLVSLLRPFARQGRICGTYSLATLIYLTDEQHQAASPEKG
jgi:hypothetical protein